MITKRTEVDKIEIVGPHRAIQVRTATVIEEDGVELSRSFHRHVIQIDDDLSSQDEDVKAIAGVLHTPARKEAFRAERAAEVEKMGQTK